MTGTAPDWLKGSITPLTTPFRDGVLDLAAYETAVDRQAQGGSAGVVVTGTTGEPTSLTLDERVELVRVAVAASRLPVIAATGTFRLDETVELTRRAAAAGASAVMIVSPGFVKPSPEGLVRYFDEVLSSVDLPALLYNIPGRAGVTVTPAVVGRVAAARSNLVGVKTASADLDYVTELLTAHGPDFRVFCGLESYAWPMMAVGAVGVMSAVANVLPREVAQLCASAFVNDVAEARRLHDLLFPLNRAIFFETNPGPIKLIASWLGFGSAEVRPPLAQPSADTAARLRDVLRLYDSTPAESAT